MPAPIGVTGKSKDHRSRRNPHMAEQEAARKKAANNTPQRRIRQLQYLLDSIEVSVKAGRQQYEDVEKDVKRLRTQLDATEAVAGIMS